MIAQGKIPLLMVIEDSDEDYEATMRALRKLGHAFQIQRFVSGDDALDYLYRRNGYEQSTTAYPNLILLDLNLPATDGREVVAEIKKHSSLCLIPVVILSTSASLKDIQFCYSHGANSYLIKPVNLQEFYRLIAVTYEYWFGVARLPEL